MQFSHLKKCQEVITGGGMFANRIKADESWSRVIATKCCILRKLCTLYTTIDPTYLIQQLNVVS